MTMMTISKLSKFNQFPTRSANHSPSFSKIASGAGEESVMEPCLWTLRDENGVIHALCLVYVDDMMLACGDSPFGQHVFESINNLYEWTKWESRVFKQCGAQVTQAYKKHTGVSQNT